MLAHLNRLRRTFNVQVLSKGVMEDGEAEKLRRTASGYITASEEMSC